MAGIPPHSTKVSLVSPIPLSSFFSRALEDDGGPDALKGYKMPVKGGDGKTHATTKDDTKKASGSSQGSDRGAQKEKGGEGSSGPVSDVAAPAPKNISTKVAEGRSGPTPQWARPQKCRYCSDYASKGFQFADGRAIAYACPGHEKRARRDVEKEYGEKSIVAVRRVAQPTSESRNGQSIARFRRVMRSLGIDESMTTTANVATVPVPIGAGDGRKFLDRCPCDEDPEKKRRRKKRRSSRRTAILRRG